MSLGNPFGVAVISGAPDPNFQCPGRHQRALSVLRWSLALRWEWPQPSPAGQQSLCPHTHPKLLGGEHGAEPWKGVSKGVLETPRPSSLSQGKPAGISLFLEGLIHLHKPLRLLPRPSFAQNRAEFEGILLNPKGKGGACGQGRQKIDTQCPKGAESDPGDPRVTHPGDGSCPAL